MKKVEDQCKLKEEERVNLELELTEVKESLKKALSGGVTLGLTIEPKAAAFGPQVRTLLLSHPLLPSHLDVILSLHVAAVSSRDAANTGVLPLLQLRH